MSDYEHIDSALAMLATQLRHVSHLQEAMLNIVHELELRSQRHDRSKLGPDELPGFARINAAARNHVFGSDEYRAALKVEKPTIDRHYASNSHHPEFHEPAKSMGWIDIIEMVCDWQAAGVTYGKIGSLRKSLEVQKDKLSDMNMSSHQWWLVEQVAEFLEPASVTTNGEEKE